MARFLLDTSVASVLEPSRVAHSTAFVGWLRSHGEQSYLSTVTLFEISQGIAKLRRGKALERAAAIETWRSMLLPTY